MNRAVISTINIIILITFLAAPAGHAQVMIEVSKITCEQYLGFSVADPRDINIWLSGYYHGKQGSTVFEPQRLKEIAEKVKSECFIKENAKLPVLQVIEKVLKASK
jgi:acid stress chaperone HdeB